MARGFRALALVVALLSGVVLGAQTRRQAGERSAMPSKEQIRAEKRAYIARELQLSAKEADQLMVVINELDEQRFALWKNTEPTRRKLQNGDTLTRGEYEQHFEATMNNRVREAELERTYYNRCRAILPIDKLIKLERAHHDFVRSFFRKKGRH
ncbi:MAG: hypothetical protein SPK09_06060 [Porphyromonas sp.]|nr:hypothetical protein [Porphyromonas sp.]